MLYCFCLTTAINGGSEVLICIFKWLYVYVFCVRVSRERFWATLGLRSNPITVCVFGPADGFRSRVFVIFPNAVGGTLADEMQLLLVVSGEGNGSGRA